MESRNSRLVKVNLLESDLKELALLSIVDNIPLNSVVISAVELYVDSRRHAPEFPEELAAARARIDAEPVQDQ